MTLVNFRDVAETVTPLVAGRLFRCGRPLDVTSEEARGLEELGVRTIVDLRGAGEAASGDWGAATALGIELRPVGTADNPAAATALPPGLTLGDLYVLLLDHRTSWLVAAIEAVADGLPTLVNCTAGKDRTGMVVALVLDLLGIDHDLIVADYERTRDSLRSGTVAKAAQGVVPPEAPRMLLDAPPEAIRTFLAAVTERGGAEDFLITHGLAADVPARLRSALLDNTRPTHSDSARPKRSNDTRPTHSDDGRPERSDDVDLAHPDDGRPERSDDVDLARSDDARLRRSDEEQPQR